MPALYEFEVELLKKANQPQLGTEQSKTYMLLPHEYVGHLWRFRRCEFNRLFLGEKDSLRAFWDHEKSQAWVEQNPFLVGKLGDEDVLAIPVGLHGDDAQYVKNGKLMILSFNGVLCRGRHSRLVITALDYGRASPNTLNQLYEVVTWSFKCLGEGKWPTTNHRGEPLSNRRAFRHKFAGEDLMGPGWVGVWSETRGAKLYVLQCCAAAARPPIMAFWILGNRVISFRPPIMVWVPSGFWKTCDFSQTLLSGSKRFFLFTFVLMFSRLFILFCF